MANAKILERKQVVIDEITSKVKDSNAVVFFEYRGLTVSEMTTLRRKLRESGSDVKVYKNTLAKRALDSLNYDMKGELNGPKAMAYGTDIIAPIKALSDFAKDHSALELKIGIVDGEVADTTMLAKLASTPSRDQLLTMFAAGLLEHVKNVAICLDLHSQNMEG
ncbi:MAG TPA: 50S ribosomal protein L10 [Bacilli bacterium]|nr:50S ribosomal protein L10 [Bacilli bacterium]